MSLYHHGNVAFIRTLYKLYNKRNIKTCNSFIARGKNGYIIYIINYAHTRVLCHILHFCRMATAYASSLVTLQNKYMSTFPTHKSRN